MIYLHKFFSVEGYSLSNKVCLKIMSKPLMFVVQNFVRVRCEQKIEEMKSFTDLSCNEWKKSFINRKKLSNSYFHKWTVMDLTLLGLKLSQYISNFFCDMTKFFVLTNLSYKLFN